jgi:hypothetical protein
MEEGEEKKHECPRTRAPHSPFGTARPGSRPACRFPWRTTGPRPRPGRPGWGRPVFFGLSGWGGGGGEKETGCELIAGAAHIREWDDESLSRTSPANPFRAALRQGLEGVPCTCRGSWGLEKGGRVCPRVSLHPTSALARFFFRRLMLFSQKKKRKKKKTHRPVGHRLRVGGGRRHGARGRARQGGRQAPGREAEHGGLFCVVGGGCLDAKGSAGEK